MTGKNGVNTKHLNQFSTPPWLHHTPTTPFLGCKVTWNVKKKRRKSRDKLSNLNWQMPDFWIINSMSSLSTIFCRSPLKPFICFNFSRLFHGCPVGYLLPDAGTPAMSLKALMRVKAPASKQASSWCGISEPSTVPSRAHLHTVDGSEILHQLIR